MGRTLLLIGSVMVTLITGFILNRSLGNYNGVTFTLHKLVALGFTVLSVLMIFSRAEVSVPGIILRAAVCLCLVLLIGSGALMSIKKEWLSFLSWIHGGTTVLLLSSLVIFLLWGIKDN